MKNITSKIREIKWPTAEELRDFRRNIAGRYQLFLVLFRWDRVYRREVWVTVLAFSLINYSILDMDNPFDYIALFVEGVILWIQLGNEFSILPKEYRPHVNGLSFGARTVTYITHDRETVPFDEIGAPLSEKHLDMYNPIKGRDLCRDTPLCSDFLNDELMTISYMPYVADDTRANYISSVHQIRYLAIRVANKKQHTTNAEKLSLDCDAAALVSGDPVKVRKTLYFDGILTSEAFRSKIVCPNLRGMDEVNTDLTQYYPVTEVLEKSGKSRLHLANDYHARVSGHIGATSLLFSENRKIVMLFQGGGKAVESNKVALGGSGSMDFKDVHKYSKEDLRDPIRRCMARETVEETGLLAFFDKAFEQTLLTGFFHWMDRSGKPEFTGITKAGEIPFAAGSRIDGDEITKSEEIPIEINTLKDFHAVWGYVEKQKINLSLSSLMALHRMTVIADYETAGAGSTRKNIYRNVSDFLFL